MTAPYCARFASVNSVRVLGRVDGEAVRGAEVLDHRDPERDRIVPEAQGLREDEHPVGDGRQGRRRARARGGGRRRERRGAACRRGRGPARCGGRRGRASASRSVWRVPSFRRPGIPRANIPSRSRARCRSCARSGRCRRGPSGRPWRRCPWSSSRSSSTWRRPATSGSGTRVPYAASQVSTTRLIGRRRCRGRRGSTADRTRPRTSACP